MGYFFDNKDLCNKELNKLLTTRGIGNWELSSFDFRKEL